MGQEPPLEIKEIPPSLPEFDFARTVEEIRRWLREHGYLVTPIEPEPEPQEEPKP